jgi:hypothetical protein
MEIVAMHPQREVQPRVGVGYRNSPPGESPPRNIPDFYVMRDVLWA